MGYAFYDNKDGLDYESNNNVVFRIDLFFVYLLNLFVSG